MGSGLKGSWPGGSEDDRRTDSNNPAPERASTNASIIFNVMRSTLPEAKCSLITVKNLAFTSDRELSASLHPASFAYLRRLQ